MASADGLKPVITTVIPTYRRPRLLRRAIASVLEQEVSGLQVFVCDNASDDDTPRVVAAIAAKDPRVVYFRHTTNIGAAANFEFGLSRVDTPFFSILSDDDYLLPGFYVNALAELNAFSAAKFWAGMTLNVDECGRIWDARVRKWPREGIFEPPEGFLQMTGGLAPTWTGMVFRSDVLGLAGTLDSTILGPSDLEFCLRLASRFPFVLKKHASAVFTLHAGSFSATEPMSSFWPGWQRMLQKFGSDEFLDSEFRKMAVESLRKDAERMLIRRGLNGLAAGRLDYVRDAANALKDDCGKPKSAKLLQCMVEVCERSEGMQRLCTYLYRGIEQQIVRSRGDLQLRYASLLRSV